MAYEDDIDPDELGQAIEESKKSQPPKPKKKKKNFEEPEPVVIMSVLDQFGGFFTEVQVRDTLIANQNDVDKTMAGLTLRKTTAEKQGKTNIKKISHEKVQKQKEE